MTTTNIDQPKKTPRKSGIPTGNAGEYFVMGELLRRGYDAQLADRNTKGYDILIGRESDSALKKVQVKTVRAQPCHVKSAGYAGLLRDQVTIFVLLGDEAAGKPARYFITRNQEVADHVHYPADWRLNGFMPLAAIKQYKDRWDILFG